ncbi:MAG: PKD domain-containing protein [Fibrobacter sp.]|nr:PKD domain-containing protein [Fibrobacter sp.]
MIRRLKLLSIAFVFLFFCAQRDNRFDPMSPLYRVKPPLLTVALNCDSNKISFNEGNRFEIVLPFVVRFSVDAKQADYNKSLPVSVQYYADSEFVEQKNSVKNYQRQIDKCGIHEFRFKSSDPDGSETEEIYTFQCLSVNRPKIKSFICNFDTLPVNKFVPLKFIALISDSTDYLDSVVYTLPGDRILKIPSDPDTLFYDTLETNVISDMEAEKEIKVFVYDKLGKGDSASITLVFNKNYEYYAGLPPVIDSIWVNEKDIHIGERIDFELSAYDKDGEIVKYFWTFGDNVFRYSDNPKASHTYYSPGNFIVKVSVVDDSGNTSMDSIAVEASMPMKSLRIHSLTATPDSGICPLKVTFKATVNDTSSDIEYKWLFGDFGSYWWWDGAETSHMYNYPGTFSVMLVVKNDHEQDTMTTIVTVAGPVLKIKADKDSVYEGDTVLLTVMGSDQEEFIHYKWSFPDTSIHTRSSEIEYVFKEAGHCHISVMAFGDQFKTGDIFINVQPDANKD